MCLTLGLYYNWRFERLKEFIEEIKSLGLMQVLIFSQRWFFRAWPSGSDAVQFYMHVPIFRRNLLPFCRGFKRACRGLGWTIIYREFTSKNGGHPEPRKLPRKWSPVQTNMNRGQFFKATVFSFVGEGKWYCYIEQIFVLQPAFITHTHRVRFNHWRGRMHSHTNLYRECYILSTSQFCVLSRVCWVTQQ